MTSAPIWRNGTATRSMGRRSNCGWPVSRRVSGTPAANPVPKRMVVPERPQSIAPTGDRGTTEADRPVIVTLLPVWLTWQPRDPTRARLARQSPAGEKFVISEVPGLQAARIAARCEIDLSLGTWQRPESRR